MAFALPTSISLRSICSAYLPTKLTLFAKYPGIGHGFRLANLDFAPLHLGHGFRHMWKIRYTAIGEQAPHSCISNFPRKAQCEHEKRLLSHTGTKAIIYFCGTTQIDAMHPLFIHTIICTPLITDRFPLASTLKNSFQATLVSPFNYRPPAVSHLHSSL